MYQETYQGQNSPKTLSTNNEEAGHEAKSSLVSRNITIFERRTSVRLEPEMWRALHDIARRETCSIHDICTLISIRKNEKTSLTAAIRVFVMLYFKAAATEEGHTKCGHGDFMLMIKRAQVADEYMRFFKGSSRKAANS